MIVCLARSAISVSGLGVRLGGCLRGVSSCLNFCIEAILRSGGGMCESVWVHSIHCDGRVEEPVRGASITLRMTDRKKPDLGRG